MKLFNLIDLYRDKLSRILVFYMSSIIVQQRQLQFRKKNTNSCKISDLKIIEQGLHDFKTIENERGKKKFLEWRVLRTLLRGKS